MSEYNLKITDIDWEEGNMYEADTGDVYVVRESNLFRVSGLARKTTGCYLNEEYDLASIAKLTFKRVIDWTKVPVDAKVLVRDSDNVEWLQRHFAEYIDGRVYCFNSGKTSWSNDNESTMPWNYAKLAGEEEK